MKIWDKYATIGDKIETNEDKIWNNKYKMLTYWDKNGTRSYKFEDKPRQWKRTAMADTPGIRSAPRSFAATFTLAIPDPLHQHPRTAPGLTCVSFPVSGNGCSAAHIGHTRWLSDAEIWVGTTITLPSNPTQWPKQWCIATTPDCASNNAAHSLGCTQVSMVAVQAQRRTQRKWTQNEDWCGHSKMKSAT